MKQTPSVAFEGWDDLLMLDHIRQGTFPIVVAFSGGKDSVAMVLYLLESGIPAHRIHLHHHDVDGGGAPIFDWACTASYCQAFAQAFGLSLYFSYRKGGIYRAIYRNQEPKQDIYYQVTPGGDFQLIPSDKAAIHTRMKFPAVSASLITRWCSAEVKIDVLRSVIAHHPAYQNKLVVLTGERRQESRNRQQYKAIAFHATHGKKRSVMVWRPLLDWEETAIWQIIERHQVQPHPAYMLGWSRCSCQLCIFSSPDIWQKIERIAPEKVKQIEAIEQDLRFTLYANKDLRAVIAAGKEGKPMSAYWIEQASGEFTAPIHIYPWQLPAGAYRTERAGAV